MPETDDAAGVVRKVLDRATSSAGDLADETGVSRDSLFAWAASRRNPSPDNLERLAAVVEEQGRDLVELADRLRELSGQ